MALTLLKVKNWLKSSKGLTRDKEDGNIDDTILLDAIHLAVKRTAKDCDLLPTVSKLALVAGQWEYPIPETIIAITDLWREDADGNKLPLSQITQAQFESGNNPVTNITMDPTQFVFPIFKGRQVQFYAKAPDNYDFIEKSRITSASIRTVIDSGANFGRTLSGDRISPGDVVHNVAADSFGYVEILDTLVNKKIQTCSSGTNSTELVGTGVDWDALGVQKDDVICYPSTGVPTSYAFVTEIDGDTLTYADMRGVLTAFAAGLSVKVGVAQKIRLTTAAPHRGLRSGSYNYFSVGSATATLVGTVFTPTTCTCTDTTGASAGEEAIASGGSHGYISSLTSTVITVDYWIGGVPVDGETVTVKECDEYVVETRPMIQPLIWLKPTPSTSDTEGTERLWISYDIQPYLPSNDWEFLDIPQRYTDCFYACCEWQVSRQTGTHNIRQINDYKTVYETELRVFGGDIHEVARGEIVTVWNNRFPGNYGHANQGVVTGHIYDVTSMVADINSS